MAGEWVKTKFWGVRYRLHQTRKHGVNFDRCFCIRYKKGGKDKEEVAGWASEGMTAEKAYKILSEIRENIRTGAHETSLRALRTDKEESRQREEHDERIKALAATTVDEFWHQTYRLHSHAVKTVATIRSECANYEKWIAPAIALVPLSELRPSHIEALMLTASSNGKSAQTVRHIVAFVSQLWNMAHLHDVVRGENPRSRKKKTRQDSHGIAFLI